MNANEVRTALNEIVRSARSIPVHGTDRERLVFDDKRAWDWFNSALEPWNDYSYRWLHNALEAIADYLADQDNLQDFEIGEHVENSVSVYTGELLDWLADRLSNLEYIDEALTEGVNTDGFRLLSRAQALAIEEVFFHTVDRVSELLEDCD